MNERANPKEIHRTPTLRVLVRAAIAVALGAVAFLGWHLVRKDDRASTGSDITAAAVTRGPGTGPVAVSEKGLKTLAAVLGESIYWGGARPGYKYSLRQTPDGKFYVRYLPPGVRVSDKRRLLVVATYPLRDAFAATEKTAKRDGGLVVRIARGGVAYFPERSPTTVYLAYPGSNYQVELFDPSPRRARKLIVSGRIARVR